ncbi:hypothetical protein GJ496_011100 [Pomphorhynchus laevis]|nr:hypothetical protein GJ496_011100 [Pomphorhynchus laevis]
MDSSGLTSNPEILMKILKLSNNCISNYKELSSLLIAKQSIDVVRAIISDSLWTNASELIDQLKELYKRYRTQFGPYEDIICNIFKRTLKLIREECARISDQVETADLPLSIMELLLPEGYKNLLDVPRVNLEDDIIDAIDEISTELENSTDELIKNASEIIHEDDRIMTFGFSPTLIRIFKESSKRYNFTLMMIKNTGKDDMLEKFISNFSTEKIQVVIVPYSNISSMLALTDKVICPAKSLLSNGSVRSTAGLRMLAELANSRRVPVIIVAGSHKLWDKYPPFKCNMNEFRHRINSGSLMEKPNMFIGDQIILRYAFDYVPYSSIDLIVSNIGKFAPSRLFSISNELYSLEDVDI